eukprot:TRINITY_DN5441_c1_g1_i10.p1 TRINITY_DN5441_c1_g1~~TRINITY_DN5441_c1_g1_i10.p1  ORF type:complete len:247 (-),score=44.91 TRINITY_DN5441_c1_g1_i10:223-909(-)
MEEMVVDTGLHKEEPTQGDTLAKLKRIRISNCPKLKYVLSVGWFQTLQNLEEIDVFNCQAMEEMVVDMGDISEANNNIPITLPRLEIITLTDLPKLKSICKRTLICSSLEEIDVEGCPMLKMLPFSINSLSSSVKQIIRGSRRWWDSLEWDNANTKMHLQPFFSERPDYRFQLKMIKKDGTSNCQSVQTTVSKGKKIKKDREPKEKHIASPNGPQLAPTFPGAAARRE